MSFSGRFKGAKPPPPGGGRGQWPVSCKKKDKFLWVKGRRGIGDCGFILQLLYAFHFYCNWRLIIIRSSLLPADVDVSPGGLNDRYKRNLFLLFSGFLWIFIRIFPIAIPSQPLNQQNLPSPLQPRNKWPIYSIVIHAETILSLFQLDTQMFIFFNASIGEMVQNIDI